MDEMTDSIHIPIEQRKRGVFESLRALISAIRPRDWSKNLLVFSGLIFSQSLTNFEMIRSSIFGFAIFCAASSGIYLLNDLCDIDADRRHPVKSKRSLASGALSVTAGFTCMIALIAISLTASYLYNRSFFLVIVAYLLICTAYILKQQAKDRSEILTQRILRHCHANLCEDKTNSCFP
jgi:4-hydroxybenzoate polyprenyltransferase